MALYYCYFSQVHLLYLTMIYLASLLFRLLKNYTELSPDLSTFWKNLSILSWAISSILKLVFLFNQSLHILYLKISPTPPQFWVGKQLMVYFPSQKFKDKILFANILHKKMGSRICTFRCVFLDQGRPYCGHHRQI